MRANLAADSLRERRDESDMQNRDPVPHRFGRAWPSADQASFDKEV